MKPTIAELRAQVESSPCHALASLTQEHRLISDYYTHRCGVGVESFDQPADRLIALGLADKYPHHFQLGSGNEGLAELLKKIGNALTVFKKAVTSGNQPKLAGKLFDPALKEIASTYASADYMEDKRVNMGKSIVGALMYYTGHIDKEGILAELPKRAAAFIALGEKLLKDTEAYWGHLESYVKKLKALDNDDVEGARKILAEAHSKYGAPINHFTFREADYVVPKYWDPKAAVTNLKTDEVTLAGKAMVDLLEAASRVSDIADKMIKVGDYYDPDKDLAWIAKAKVPHLDVLCWDNYMHLPNNAQCAMIEAMMDMVELIEKWILGSLK